MHSLCLTIKFPSPARILSESLISFLQPESSLATSLQSSTNCVTIALLLQYYITGWDPSSSLPGLVLIPTSHVDRFCPVI